MGGKRGVLSVVVVLGPEVVEVEGSVVGVKEEAVGSSAIVGLVECQCVSRGGV